MKRWCWGLLGVILLGLTACDDNPTGPDDGVRHYEFALRDLPADENFVAQTSDPAVIRTVDSLLALPAAERSTFIIGDLARGNDGYNNDWGWHFVPDAWQMAEVAVEVCDGRPSMVEEDLDYWIDTVGYFCPWSSYVVREVEP